MSAQDDELALDAREYDPGDTQRSLNKQEDFEEENNAPQSTQSTWKGFESDDEVAVGPPGTPERKVGVIYNPSSTETSADELANVEPSPPAEELIADAGDDNVSVFSMTNYGSMDWDHTGDELDKMEVAPKITRRDSTNFSENHTRVFYELAPLTPRNKRRSTSSTSVSEKRTSSLQRDSKGRFAPKSTLSSATPSLVRDGMEDLHQRMRLLPRGGLLWDRRQGRKRHVRCSGMNTGGSHQRTELQRDVLLQALLPWRKNHVLCLVISMRSLFQIMELQQHSCEEACFIRLFAFGRIATFS